MGMSEQSFQTTRLSAGRHSGPDQGACVMELASMLAGETFTDHPRSTCQVIGKFLRDYNDRIDDDRRQDLYAYAARVVGSRGPRKVRRERGTLLRAWAHEQGSRINPRSLFVQPFLAAREAARIAATPGDERNHREVLRLLDELLAIGGCDGAAPAGPPQAGPAAGKDADRSSPLAW
jgi:hypothetical protein